MHKNVLKRGRPLIVSLTAVEVRRVGSTHEFVSHQQLSPSMRRTRDPIQVSAMSGPISEMGKPTTWVWTLEKSLKPLRKFWDDASCGGYFPQDGAGQVVPCLRQ